MFEKLKGMFLTDFFAQKLGIEIAGIKDGFAKTVMTVDGSMINGVKVANGGVAFTLADYALAIAANTQGDNVLLTSSVNMHYCAPAKLGDVLAAEASIDARTGRNIFLKVVVRNQDERVIAVAQGVTAEIAKPKPI